MNESCSLRRANSTSVTRSGSAAAACAAANLCALDWEAIGTKELLKRVGCRKAFGCKTGVAQLCFRQRNSNCLCPRAPHTCNTQARKQRVLENEPAACSEVRIIIITITDHPQHQRNKIWKCLCYAAKAMEAKHFFVWSQATAGGTRQRGCVRQRLLAAACNARAHDRGASFTSLLPIQGSATMMQL
jgi:hypothetical protein